MLESFIRQLGIGDVPTCVRLFFVWDYCDHDFHQAYNLAIITDMAIAVVAGLVIFGLLKRRKKKNLQRT